MADFKSKLPDFQELSNMTDKLFKAVKKGVSEIVEDYKKKRTAEQVATSEPVVPPVPPLDPVQPEETPGDKDNKEI